MTTKVTNESKSQNEDEYYDNIIIKHDVDIKAAFNQDDDNTNTESNDDNIDAESNVDNMESNDNKIDTESNN